MSVATGVIRGGQLVLQGESEEPLPEGKSFTVLIDDDDDGFQLDEESVKLLLESQARIRRGERVGLEEVKY